MNQLGSTRLLPAELYSREKEII